MYLDSSSPLYKPNAAKLLKGAGQGGDDDEEDDAEEPEEEDPEEEDPEEDPEKEDGVTPAAKAKAKGKAKGKPGAGGSRAALLSRLAELGEGSEDA